MVAMAASTTVSASANGVKWNVRFVSLPHALLIHDSFNALSGGATKLLLAMACGYVGNNNGQLVATHSLMKSFGFNSKESLSRGIRELIQCGYIIRTRTQNHRSSALYALTWLPINPARHGESYDPGIRVSGEALDLWRCSGPIMMGAAA